MKISFTKEEITELRKFLNVLGLDISTLGGLSEEKSTLYIKPTTVCQQIAIRRHDIAEMGPIKTKGAKGHIIGYLKDNFEGSMIAK